MEYSCVCGNTTFDHFDRDCWKVDVSGALVPSLDKQVKFGRCTKCGVVRQLNLPYRTVDEYIEYYLHYPPTVSPYVAKDWKHDLEVACARCDSYGLMFGADKRILDVGSGSGAFVYECRRRGLSAYGCEIARYKYDSPSASEFVYRKRLEDVHFPTDHFDLVTCHDVLEHVLDPIAMLKEMHRVTQQGGYCIVEVPRFMHPLGAHHWKDGEHVWFFDEVQLQNWLQQVGFVVMEVWNPIESKIAVKCVKPEEDRPTILVPPGIGDSYWVMVKMQSFLERERLGIPDVGILCNREKRFQGHLRAVPFLQMFPFIHCTGKAIPAADNYRKIWLEAYTMANGRSIFKNVLGYDYFISYNGKLGHGEQLERIDNLRCDWLPPMFVSLEQMSYQRQCEAQFGRYLALFFPFYGTYRYWTKEFPVSSVIRAVSRLREATECSIVLVGERWDAEDEGQRKIVESVPDVISLLGKTNVAQLFGLLKGAEAVVGFPSGLTFMAAAFGCKTLAIWNDYYNRDFFWHAVPPDTRAKTYFIEHTKGLTVDRLVAAVEELVKTGVISGQRYQVTGDKGGRWLESVPKEENQVLGRVSGVISRVKRPSGIFRSVQKKVASDAPAILCVLKSGGDFTIDYVMRLKNMLQRTVTVPYRFVCLTDVTKELNSCETVPIQDGHKGYWSKIEMFRPGLLAGVERVLYFDLDVVILCNIDDLVMLDSDFAALRPWNPENRTNGMLASGVMLWRNDKHSYIYEEFDIDLIPQYRRGDQEYITNQLRKHHVHSLALQDVVSGIYSYKRQCMEGLPEDARIVCFHGRPRPHEVVSEVEWVQRFWR